jgi:hypothetical protein
VLVVLALAAVWFILWRRRRARARAWRDELARTIPDVRLARDLLADFAGERVEADQLEALRHRVDAVAAALGQLAASAPNDDARVPTSAAEQALRGSMGAIEAEQLLRASATGPSDATVEDTIATRTAHANALDAALTRLDALAGPPPVDGTPAVDATGSGDTP